jgi:hypothetical protein
MTHTRNTDALNAALSAFDFSCDNGLDPVSRQQALREAMRLTPHGNASNTLEHGIDCAKRYRALLDDIAADRQDPSWPQWLGDNAQALAEQQIDLETTLSYLTHHDCGKPGTMTIDEAGRLHFPGHAQASALTWARAGGSSIECELMAKDMVLHTASAEEAGAFATDPLAMTLLLCAHVEIESNALSVFGGIDSTSHKIKKKALARRARAILAARTPPVSLEKSRTRSCRAANQDAKSSSTSSLLV